jgi:hypothetical protein
MLPIINLKKFRTPINLLFTVQTAAILKMEKWNQNKKFLLKKKFSKNLISNCLIYISLQILLCGMNSHQNYKKRK